VELEDEVPGMLQQNGGKLPRPTAIAAGFITVLPVLLFGFAAAAQTADADKPILRIETGMHTAAIHRIAVDAQERFLVSASDDKTARIWDLRTGELLQVLRPPQGEGTEGKLYAVAISPDGSVVAVGGYTGPTAGQIRIYVFDRATGRILIRIDGLPNVVYSLSYSSDGQYLVAAFGGSNGIGVYRADNGKEVFRDKGYGADSNWAEFDRGGRLVTTSDDGNLRLYGPGAEFRLLVKRAAPGGKQPFVARFSPDGSKVAVSFDDSTAVNVLSGRDLVFEYAPDTKPATGSLNAVAWSVDGRILYAGGRYSESGVCRVLSWQETGRGTLRIWPASTNTILYLHGLSGNRVAFATYDPSLGVLQAEGRKVWEHTPDTLDHRDSQANFRLAADGATVDFGYHTLTDSLGWVPHVARFAIGDHRLLLDPALDPSLRQPRTTGLKITNWENSEKPRLDGRDLVLKPFETSRSLAITDTAQNLLLGTDWWLRFYDRQGKERWNVPVPGVAWAVNLTADSRYAVAALGDGTIRWYSIADNGKEVLALFVHKDRKRWVIWTSDGFFDASPGGEDLVGYHLNQGPDHEGQFIKVDQLFKQFYRPDLIAQALKPEGPALIRAALTTIGDIRATLASGLPPELQPLTPAENESDGEFEFGIRVINRGGGTGRVVYRIDGIEIEGRAVDIPGVGTDTVNRRFSLSPGPHRISATVYNARNQIESRPVFVNVNVKSSAARPALYVVAAGVSTYRDNALNDGVKFAAADAAMIASRLKTQGTGLFREVVTYPLTNDQATGDGIRAAVRKVAEKIQPNDVFILYLAGHGAALEGEYHFLPYEVRYTSADALRRQALNQDAIGGLLKLISARKTLVLLDTCSSGAFALGPSRQLGEKAAIDRLGRITGRAVLAASGSEQMAMEGYREHGVFTYALLEGLSQTPPDEQGFIEVSKLADFVEDLVPKITMEKWHYEQFPMRDLKGQTFPIARRP
jgi:dipeptidyl aminopeptidase/acylaminoacyl peptidase